MTGRSGYLVRLLRRPAAALSLAWLLAVTVCSLRPSAVTDRSPLEQDLAASLQGPSAAHPLGTDRLGQDLLSRLAHGGADSLWGVLVAVTVSTALGVSLGLLAGYRGGVVDAIVMRISDMLFAVPAIILLLVVVAVYPNNVTVAMITFGVLLASGLIRIVRGATRSLREELFIAAARVSGLSGNQILQRHLLPRLASLVTVQISLMASLTLITQAGLAFLGFGPPPPQSSWGGLIDEARGSMTQHPWSLVPPGLTVALTVLAFSMLGDAVRDTTTQSWSSSKLGRRKARQPARVVTVAAAQPVPRPGSLLTVRQLSVVIPAATRRRSQPGTVVVSDVSFDIAGGEVVGLVGESGCGKTVTALSVLGLIPGGGWISGGDCSFAGQSLTTASAAHVNSVRGRGIGYIAQDPMASLDPTARAGTQVAEAVRRHTGAGRSQARKAAVELLRTVGLPHPERVARQYPHQMSGGMAQRVAIAFALAGSPRLLIADEPTTALDVTVQAEVLSLLRTLSVQRRMAILIVTHDLGVVAELCDRVLVMYAGQIVEACTAAELFAAPRHPYTKGLLASDPHRSTAGQQIPTIAGTVPAPADWPLGCRFADRCTFAAPECRRAPVAAVELSPAHLTRCVRAHELFDAAVIR